MMKSLRVAWLSLVRSPDYAIAAAILVATGVAAVTTVFAVADAILLRPVRYQDPARLYFLFTQHQPERANFPPSVADFQDYERSTTSFDAMGIAVVASVVIPTNSGAESHRLAHVSPGLLRTLRVQPSIGRGLIPTDDQPAAQPVVVLSHESWLRLFGGDSTIVNRTLTTASGQLTVVGVLPPSTMFPNYAIGLSALAPFVAQNPSAARRDARTGTLAVARLRQDASLTAARAELTMISRQLADAYPTSNANWIGSLESLSVAVADQLKTPTLLLLGGAFLVLIIAATNVAVLSLVRSHTRAHESALRRALGARTIATLAPRLLDATLVTIIGGVTGLLLAKWSISVIAASLTSIVARVSHTQLDSRAVLVAATAAGVFLVFAVLTALPQASARNLVQRLKPGSVAAARGRRFAPQNLLVVSQVALSLVLALAGLSIVGASLAALREGPGIDVARLVSFPVEPPKSRYASPAAQQALLARLRDRLLALPGVENVGLINHAPLTQAGVLTPVHLATQSSSSGGDMAVYRAVDERYFAAAGQTVLEGRNFVSSEMNAGSRSVLVNESFARKFWPSASAIGKSVRVFDQSPIGGSFNAPLDVVVVGVVRDVRDWGFSRPTLPAVYVPFTVSPWPTASFAIRAVSPRGVLPGVRQVFSEIEPLLPMSGARLGEELVAESEAPRRAAMWIVIAFGVTATLLACFGIYAVIAQQVVRRARETGIRIAIGGTPSGVVARFVVTALGLCAAGLLLGLGLTPALRGLLAQATPTPITLSLSTVAVAVSGLLFAVTLAAFLAARRASQIAPVQLLRAE